MNFEIINIKNMPELTNDAAQWFNSKWGVPIEAYLDSMNDALVTDSGIPSWYVAYFQGKIIGGVGIIENDFHNRPDLRPNVCALFVEERFRGNGLAGKLLSRAIEDMSEKGLDILYLLTDHDSFYERYGWEFFCLVQGDGEENMSRMYIHRNKEGQAE